MEWIWLSIIVIAILLDFFTSDFLFAGFALGALIALIISFIGAPVILQIIIFGALGVIFIFSVYPIIKKKLKKDSLGTKKMEENYIGQTLTLEKDLLDEGLIKFNGIYWTFKTISGPLSAGSSVKIIKIEGNKLIVEKNI